MPNAKKIVLMEKQMYSIVSNLGSFSIYMILYSLALHNIIECIGVRKIVRTDLWDEPPGLPKLGSSAKFEHMARSSSNGQQ